MDGRSRRGARSAGGGRPRRPVRAARRDERRFCRGRRRDGRGRGRRRRPDQQRRHLRSPQPGRGTDRRGRLAVYGTNVVSIVRMTSAFVPILRASSAPTIVNVTSGLGSFALVHDPERIESKVNAPLYTSSKAAVTMLTVQYAKAFPEMRINAADPGYTATDFNGNNGTQTVQEGTDAIVDLATRGGGGPTGTFIDRSGVAPF